MAGPVNEAAVALLLFMRAFAAPQDAEHVREALRDYLVKTGCGRVVVEMRSRRADVVNTLEIEARCLAPKEATR